MKYKLYMLLLILGVSLTQLPEAYGLDDKPKKGCKLKRKAREKKAKKLTKIHSKQTRKRNRL